MTRTTSCSLAAACALLAFPAMAASVSTAWAPLPANDQEECLRIGARAVASLGFEASVPQDRQTVFGWRGEEALVVRCIAASGVAVVFAWVTDQSNDSSRLVDAVTAAYRGRGRNLGAGSPGGGSLGGGGNLGGNPGPGTFGGAPGGGVVKR